MTPSEQQKLRQFLRERLDEAGDADSFDDASSLFVSGRLDSLTMTRLVLFLEETFRVDFSAVNFEVELIDSVEAIAALKERETQVD
jgi:acyl carrier protein